MNNIKFVGLHAHSVAGSIFDALGFPQEHMDFYYENGGDALALTDHGNMNVAYQVLHAKKMQAQGKNFKPIMAVRLISFHPSKSGVKNMRNPFRTRRKRNKSRKMSSPALLLKMKVRPRGAGHPPSSSAPCAIGSKSGRSK